MESRTYIKPLSGLDPVTAAIDLATLAINTLTTIFGSIKNNKNSSSALQKESENAASAINTMLNALENQFIQYNLFAKQLGKPAKDYKFISQWKSCERYGRLVKNGKCIDEYKNKVGHNKNNIARQTSRLTRQAKLVDQIKDVSVSVQRETELLSIYDQAGGVSSRSPNYFSPGDRQVRAASVFGNLTGSPILVGGLILGVMLLVKFQGGRQDQSQIQYVEV